MKKRQLTPTGKRIVKRLVDMNQTQIWLCNEIGVSKSYLTRILHGERSGRTYLSKIDKALGFNEEE